jgi:hypothetical protein
MARLTVRLEDGRDIEGDTVYLDDEEIRILGSDETETVKVSDVRSIIAGELAGQPDDDDVDGSEALLA